MLQGPDLVYLSMYGVVCPKATIAEVLPFLYWCNLGNLDWTFFSQSQISLAEKRIGMTRKKASTTAYQAYLFMNIRKRWNFWIHPFLLGITDIPQNRIIDIDTSGLYM